MQLFLQDRSEYDLMERIVARVAEDPRAELQPWEHELMALQFGDDWRKLV